MSAPGATNEGMASIAGQLEEYRSRKTTGMLAQRALDALLEGRDEDARQQEEAVKRDREGCRQWLQIQLGAIIGEDIGGEKIEVFGCHPGPLAVTSVDGLTFATFGGEGHNRQVVTIHLMFPCGRCGLPYEGSPVHFLSDVALELERYTNDERDHPVGKCPLEIAERWAQDEAIEAAAHVDADVAKRSAPTLEQRFLNVVEELVELKIEEHFDRVDDRLGS